MNINRLKRVINSMKEKNIYQFVITDRMSIYYLTNINIHSGERFLGLYINQNNEVRLINNQLFPLNNNDIDILYYSDTESAVKKLSKFVRKDKNLGIDKVMTSNFLLEMMELNIAESYLNASSCIDYVRMQKDEDEIKKMIKASEINDKSMNDIINFAQAGMKEIDVLEELKLIYKRNGADDAGFSFEPIIAFGANAANPHYSTGDTVIGDKGCLVIDMGCIYDGYCSDMTRTIFFGEPNEEAKNIYNIVKTANERAIDKVKEGLKFSDIDNEARSYITENGYGEYFTHRTGHCIGMDVHEYGDVSSIHHANLKEGMIFSIEPGIYCKDKNIGVRIEDLILVTKDGHKNLNSFTKEMIIK
ncbi:Xaa-Pro peptidase family protein [Brachyspira sp. G79]|uniref:M24 family metallopeptidase n=1 Tax=Brachyspira sp. G79 TaxID=1358104 RepID=UPI000BBC320B|nr:Xaa-Pro peptidase family protein [Brachyspira sp. G79]PCG19560.1 proline dipeptidase [Brachyspira sp. G79]